MSIERTFGRGAVVLACGLTLLVAGSARAQIGLAGAALLEQGVGGFPDTSEEDDNLGSALAAGDFDGDGWQDLAIGARCEQVFPGESCAGQVSVVYGTPGGLDPASGTAWALDDTAFAPGLIDDELGASLAAGDFDGDGYDDLAVGIPNRDAPAGPGAQDSAGAVLVLYGGPGGIALAGQQLWHQGRNGVDGVPEPGDHFGFVLATGNFNGDPFDDLAVGVPGEDVGAVQDSGAVNVIYGSPSGLSPTFAPIEDQIWVQTDLGLSIEEIGDYFGWSVAAGDFDQDGRDDLAIGSPFEDVGPIVGAGAVSVMYGTGLGLSAAGAQWFSQDEAAVPGAEPADSFGYSVLAADLDGDGWPELVAGSPGEDLELGPTVEGAGAIHVVRGSAAGLESEIAWAFDRRDASGVPGFNERFGDGLAAGSFGADRPADLVVGARNATVAGHQYAGAAFVFAGRAGAAPLFERELSQEGPAPGTPGPWEGFSWSLAAADFDGNGFDDLAAGVPWDTAGGDPAAGAVNLFRGQGVFRDGFESGGTTLWSAAVSN